MTTNSTKIFDKAGGVGVDFTTDAQLSNFIYNTNCITSDSLITVLMASDYNPANTYGSGGASKTQRVILRPMPGMGVNDLNRVAPFNQANSGVGIIYNKTNGSANLMGVSIIGMRVVITGTGAWTAIVTNGEFAYNRLYDTSTTAQGDDASIKFNATYITDVHDNLSVVGGVAGKSIFCDPGVTVAYRRNTYAAIGAALGGTIAVRSTYAIGNTCINEVMIGMGPQCMIQMAATNCYSNTTPTSGVINGITVNTAVGGLVVNEANDFRPAAGGMLIGTATAEADTTLDILGNNRGSDPDIGSWELSPVVALAKPNATVTSVDMDGRQVTVHFTFTSTAQSGVVNMVPSGAPNGAVGVSKPAVLGNDNTGYAVFPLASPGNYVTPTVVLTNQSGDGTTAGNTPYTVAAPPVPTVTILTQTKKGRSISFTGTYTGAYPNEPISGTYSIAAAGTPNGAVSKGPVSITLNPNGTCSGSIMNLNYGEYANSTVTVTNISGTGTATGGAVSIVSPARAIGVKLTNIVFQNTTVDPQTNVPVTFGQVFKEGHLPLAGAAVNLRAPDNSIVPCQIDVKAEHPDGSVRHAVLSAIIPALAGNSSVSYDILRAAVGPTGNVLVPADFAGLNATATITATGSSVNGPVVGLTYTADAAALLAAGTYETWLSGPISSEWIVTVPFKTAGNVEHPDLHARFSIRAYRGQAKAKIDYVIENSWAEKLTVADGNKTFKPLSLSEHIYRFSLKAGNAVVDTRAVKGSLVISVNNVSGLWSNTLTGLANNATVYTATVTVNGTAKPLSVTGSQVQTYGELFTKINEQLVGFATIAQGFKSTEMEIKSIITGTNSTVVMSNYGTLFPALGYTTPYRPIFGDEYVHYAKTRWKKTFWWGTAPAVHIAHNKAYMIEAGAVSNYKSDLVGSTVSIDVAKANMAENGDIGQNGITKSYMAGPGAAPGIGILPEWVAMYVVNQGKDAKDTMLKQADLSGSWPTIFRDKTTNQPINFATYPFASAVYNEADAYNAATGLNERIPDSTLSAGLAVCNNIPDTAHHPDFNYVPYMVTGDHFYMEGMLFAQRFVVLSNNPASNYRDGRKNLWWPEQPRGFAWAMRTTLHAYYLVPTNHVLRADLAYQINANYSWINTNYLVPNAPSANALGVYIGSPYTFPYATAKGAQTGISPWQDSFITQVVGRAVELGLDEWLPFLQFKTKFSVGMYTSGSAFCWQWGGDYKFAVRDGVGSPVYSTFSQIKDATYSDRPAMLSATCGTQAMTDAMAWMEGSRLPLNSIAGYPDIVTGYGSNMQPALAYAATYDTAGGDDAWTVFESRSVKPDYNAGPQFAIEPRPTVADEVIPPPGATAFLLAGPSGGDVGANSTIFTVGANGTISGTLVVTPTSSAGGTFTPSTVSLTSGNPTATFTYNPASSGVKSINVFGALAAPASVVYIVAGTVEPPPDEDPTGVPIYPPVDSVAAGVQYGPTGVEYVGTYVPPSGGGGGTSATVEEIAAAVWGYQTALSIPQFLAIK